MLPGGDGIVCDETPAKGRRSGAWLGGVSGRIDKAYRQRLTVLAKNLRAGGYTLTIIERARGDALEVGFNRIVVHGFCRAATTHQSGPTETLLAGHGPIAPIVSPEGSMVDGHG